MKVKLFIWALMLIWFVSCSIPGDPSEDITIENYKINIVFDRETFEFDTMNLAIELDPIAFPESLKVAPIRDITSQDFNDFFVEGGSKSDYLEYDGGAPHNIGEAIPVDSTTIFIDGILNHKQFLWANTDSMRVDFSIENKYNELIFDSLNIVLLRKDTMYTGMPGFLNGYREVINTGFSLDDFQSGITFRNSLLLDKVWITDSMTLKVTVYNLGLTLTEPLNSSQNLPFNINFEDCKFHRAFANFHAQVDNQTDTYSRGDSTEYGNIRLRSIILKDFQFSVDSRNETDLYVEIDGQVDNFYNLRLGEDHLVDVDTLKIQPNSGFIPDIIGPYNLDSCRFEVNYADQSATVTHDSWGRAAKNSPDYPYVELDQNDSVHFYFEIESADPGQNFIPFYEIDALVSNETIEISETTSGFADEIDWDDYDGVSLNMMNLKAEASFSREDLEMDVIILENFRMIGVKNGIQDPGGWVNLRDTTLYDFNNGILDLEEIVGGNSFSDLINNKPDAIEYMANVTMTFDGVLKYDDKLQLELLVSTPLEITITNSLVKELDVHKMEQLDMGNDSEVLSLHINSFINIPSDDFNAKIKFTVNISDSTELDLADSTEILVDEIRVFSLEIMSNSDAGFERGYMLNELTSNNFDEKGISFPDSVVNMMMGKDTYLQEIITITPTGDDPIVLSDTGFIEVQTKLSGEFKLSTGDGE